VHVGREAVLIVVGAWGRAAGGPAVLLSSARGMDASRRGGGGGVAGGVHCWEQASYVFLPNVGSIVGFCMPNRISCIPPVFCGGWWRERGRRRGAQILHAK
jgi:hypothetical protein